MRNTLVLVAGLLLTVGSLDARTLRKKHLVAYRNEETGCPDGYRKCPTSDRCISSSYFCDGDNDCGDDSDETADCPPVACGEGSFKCKTRNRCLRSELICDGENHCGDNSDESEDCQTRHCPIGMLKCASGQCILKDYYCSGYFGCTDGMRIANADCPAITCEDGSFKCPNISKCIGRRSFCNGKNDCGDKSDEPDNCSELPCDPHDFRCNNGQCLNRAIYCMGVHWYGHGCNDNTDISSICTDFQCPEGYSKCISDATCVTNSQLCNGVHDCNDGSDESLEHCMLPVECPTGQSRCPKNRRCISSRYLCDTDNDCRDNSDEDPSFCSSRTCQPDEFRCNNGQCIDKEGFCAGFYSCRDGSVEISNENCDNPLPVLPDQLSPECIAAMLTVHTQCGDPSALFGTLRNKLSQMDMRELCSPFSQWLQCVSGALSACAATDHPMVIQAKRSIDLMAAVVSYVCEEHVDVINRHKACLLRDDNDEQVMPALAESVTRTCMPLMGQLSTPQCPSFEAQACAKNIIAEQCGDDIAVVLNGLADRIRAAAQCPTSRLRSTGHMKRRGFPYHSQTFNFLKSFF